MRKYWILFLVLTPLLFSASNKKLFPNKYKGIYEGRIEAASYKTEAAEKDEIQVSETMAVIDLAHESVAITIGKYKRTGSIGSAEKTKEYYALEVSLEDKTKETWRLYRKEKRIERITGRSQTNTTLFKK